MTNFQDLNTLFNKVLQKYAEKPAIVFNDHEKTYFELNENAKKFCVFFQQKKIKQGQIIGIISTKSFNDYSVMIACLKLGIGYVNIDIENPYERNFDIVDTCKPTIIFSKIYDKNIKTICNEHNIEFIKYENISNNQTYSTPIETNNLKDNVAYIMFTSGSTGKPKGVSISHKNIVQFIVWAKQNFNLKNCDNFTNINPMYFDNSVFDFYCSLFNGASFTPIVKSLLNNPLKLLNYIDEKKCTVWFSVPSMLIYLNTMNVLNNNVLQNINKFIFGGEGFPKPELKKIFNIYKNAQFINVYGPTECTCIISSYEITNNDFKIMNELAPLGKISKSQYLILDKNNNICTKGELYIIGKSVGMGYYNNNIQTKEKFLTHIDENQNILPMYKTGDIVELKNDLIYFCGRDDRQIKHMGYRIELEEIENNLNFINGVIQSVVIYKKQNTELFGNIIAFLQINNKNIIKNIKNELENKIPKYMHPHQYVIVEKFKKNQNGKIDKNILKNCI